MKRRCLRLSFLLIFLASGFFGLPLFLLIPLILLQFNSQARLILHAETALRSDGDGVGLQRHRAVLLNRHLAGYSYNAFLLLRCLR